MYLNKIQNKSMCFKFLLKILLIQLLMVITEQYLLMVRQVQVKLLQWKDKMKKN